MNDQCSLLKNKDQIFWAKQFSGNVIGYTGSNSQMAYTCNPYGTDPIVSCPNNGEFKYYKGEGCTTLIKGKAGIDISNDTNFDLTLTTKTPIALDTNFSLTPNAKIVTNGQPLGCGCKSENGNDCLLNWPVTLSSSIDANGSVSVGSPFPINAKFDINANIEGETGWFPFPGNATGCERIAYNAPKLGCCLNKKDVVQVYNGIPYTCDVNTTHKYSMDCGATIADYCSTPDFFYFNGSPQNGSNGGISFDNRNFKEWLKNGKCFNYFNSDSTNGKIGNNSYDAMELVLNKSIPAINSMYPVDNPGGDIITTLTFDNGFFQINYGVSGNGIRININGSYEINELITNIQDQINTGLGVNAITFGVINNKFYLTPNQNNNIMQVLWIPPFSDPKTAIILGGQNVTGKFSKGQQYIFPNNYQGVNVSTGKEIWDNVAKAITTAKSGTSPLKEICKNYTREEIEASYSASSNEPDKRILAKMCACNLSSNNYSNFGGQIPPSDYAVCDPLCLSSGSVPRFKSGVMEVCNNTNCIIDNTTINFVNSTSGDITFNQVCKSGNGANCYFSDNNVFNQASKIGKVKINQNCGKCFVYNPSSPFQPTQVDCLTGELPVTNKIWNYILQLWQNHKWIIIGIGITIIIIIILLIVLRNISNKTSQTQSLINALNDTK